MSKNIRKESQTGFYHVMARGVNRQSIFQKDDDRRVFIGLLKDSVFKMDIEIHSFCLMENHLHILIKTEKKILSEFMRFVLSNYVRYFNKTQNRIGHLFENRFKSEPVNDEKYYLTVLRYILQNPEKAFLSTTQNYQWSSINAYSNDSFVNTEFALGLFKSKKSFYRFILEKNNDECLDLVLTREEKELKNQLIVKAILGNTNLKDITKISKYKRNYFIHEMKRNGISIRGIESITGLGKGIIQRI